MNLAITLLGRFALQDAQGIPVALETGKARELFCYLLLNRHVAHHREVIASILWPQTTTGQSKRYLSKALWQLQSTLSTCGNALLISDTEWIEIDPTCEFWLDVAILEQAFDAVKHLPGPQLSAKQASQIQQAIYIYRSELLNGWYQDWCVIERERLQHLFLTLVDKLMLYHEAQQAYLEAISCGQQILRYDRARECTHRRLMRAYYLAGDRSSAMRQYQRCEAILRDELQTRPGYRTQALHQQIDTDSLMRQQPSGPFSQGQLGSMQARLQFIHEQLQHEILFLKQLRRDL